MEEKERYQLERPNGTFSEIHDTKLDVWYSNRQPITELLNKQDKHIKELKHNSQQLLLLFKSYISATKSYIKDDIGISFCNIIIDELNELKSDLLDE